MCSMANGLFSYWPQFVASITAAQRILGSAGQSWANFRHHALLSPDPLPSKWVGNHQLGWLDFGTGVRDKRGMESSFLPIQFGCWCMPHAGAGKVTDQPSLPSFPLLFVSVGKIKKVLGGWGLFILIQFLATKSYKNIQRYFTHYQFATVFPSSHCHCPPFPRSSPETFEKTMYGYMMTFISYLQSVFPKEGVFHIPRSDKNTIQSLCASQWP